MQPAERKEESGSAGQPSGPSAVQGLPWWGGVGQQPLQAVSSSAVKPLFLEHSSGIPAPIRPMGFLHPHVMQPSPAQVFGPIAADGDCPPLGASRMQPIPQSGYDESIHTEHQQQPVAPTVFPPPPGEYLLPHTQLELGHSMAQAPYPYADPYYGGFVAAYVAQGMVHPHMLGVQQARMPLPSEMVEEEPVYVNAKQYHGILRRRKSRAKAESENKLVKIRKPYLHESRHQHALKRERGCGGRFLNTKSKEKGNADSSNKSSEGQSSQGSSTPDGSTANLEQVLTGSQSLGGQTVLSLPGQVIGGLGQTNANATGYRLSHGAHPILPSSASQGSFYNSHQSQPLHASAFRPLPGGSDEGNSGQNGIIMSNGSQQRAVATQ